MIISFLNQKGGAGKTTLARAVAVEFAKNEWGVHVADMDSKQQTFFKWAQRRNEQGVSPEIEASIYNEPKSALKAAAICDVLIVDGKAFADSHIRDFSASSDMIIIPTGTGIDDLQPSLDLANELVTRLAVRRERILFVLSKVSAGRMRYVEQAKNTISTWGYNVCEQPIKDYASYETAMNEGRAITESGRKTVNDLGETVIQEIFNRITILQEENV